MHRRGQDKVLQAEWVVKKSLDEVFTELFCITNPEKLVFNGDFNGDLAQELSFNFRNAMVKLAIVASARKKRKNFFLR